MGNFRSLDPRLIHQKLVILKARITERFPESGLSGVARELLLVSDESEDRLRRFLKPNYTIRITSGLLIFLILSLVAYAISQVGPIEGSYTFFEIVQGVEAGVNDIVFISIAIFFLGSIETRIKRKRILAAMDELRAFAHIIDMHQLSKDPQSLIVSGKNTPSSPQRVLTSFEVGRYLDYCSEMLSLIGKLSALYVEKISDPVVLGSANEIETLTSDLSRKIWQKIIILQNKT